MKSTTDEIVYTGLRPGEKLHEELIVEGEDASRTVHPKVMMLIGIEKMPPPGFSSSRR